MKHMLLKARNGLFVSAVAGFMLVGWSLSASAQNCTTANWTSAVGLADGVDNATGNVGTPPTFRRYAGPCALRVPVDGTARYVIDDSPAAESSYIARFYVFLNNSGSAPIVLFEALGSGDAAQLRLTYTAPNLTLEIFNNGQTQSRQFTNLENGWQSVELSWAQGATANVSLTLNGDTLTAEGVDTAGRTIERVRMGNVAAAGVAQASTTVDFDDFDSRRSSNPGRLCRGLTDQTRDSLTFGDAIAIFSDASSAAFVAPGQPDYDENGLVTFGDAIAVFNRAAGASTRPCAANR